MVFLRQGIIRLALTGFAGLAVFSFKTFNAKTLVPISLASGIFIWLFLGNFGGQPYTKVKAKKYSNTYQFKQLKPEEIGALHLNISQGYALVPFLQFTLQYWRYIDFRTYGHRFLAVLGMSILNSTLSCIETLIYGIALKFQPINDAPIFILGHPRSGTTMVHNLLSENPAFVYPTTFFCGFPNGCNLLEPFKSLFAGSISDTRPMDNMPLSLDTPQEDELALTMLAGGCSPYSPLTMMECEPEFRQYFNFDVDSEFRLESKGVLEYKFGLWKSSLLYFLKKVYFSQDRSGQKPIVLKSPVHTGRVKLLRRIFPKAKFVYIHREPYRVFQSACNMAEKTYVHSCLMSMSNERLQDFIVTQYKILFKNYVTDKKDLPKEALFEISYDELTQDVVGTFEKLYKHFGWKNFEDMRPKYEDYQEKSKKFKKNSLKPMDEGLKEVIYEEWKEAFEYFGYKK